MNKVLLIDDDAKVIMLVGAYLRHQGFELLDATDGEEGLGLALDRLPDLVVCDLDMPGLDGFGVLDALRREPKLADVPVIFLTGYSDHASQRHGMNLGADDYLPKPVDLEDLRRAIQARLQRHQAERERSRKRIDLATRTFAGIIHDLRDPLFVVCGYADLLNASTLASSSAPDRSKEILERMQRATVRVQSIISEVMFLARSRMQRLPFDPGPFDLRNFIERLVADHEASGRLRFDCRKGDFPIVADALRLRQMLENLISNALKYSEAFVQVRLSAGPEGYQVGVHDEGIGIPPAEQASLFEPFFRASNAKDKPGHGLGLSIAKSCVEQHGGTLSCSSRLGKGTTFTIQLPISAPSSPDIKSSVAEGKKTEWVTARQARPQREALSSAPPAGAATAPRPLVACPSPEPLPNEAPAPGPEPGPRETCTLRGIIVDDDALVRGLLRDLLEEAEGVIIQGEAGSVAEGRLLLKQQSPQVIFLDVRLPDGMGFDLLRDVKPNTSVVFVSSAEEYAVHAFDCEALDYLLKPVSRERLRQTLCRVRKRLVKPADSVDSSLRAPKASFLVKTLKGKEFVNISQVKTIIAYGEYSWVYWGKDEGALLRKPLKRWQAELPESHFVRVHRHAIINLAFLDHMEKLAEGRIQAHMRDTANPILVSMRLTSTVNRKLKTFGSGGERPVDPAR